MSTEQTSAGSGDAPERSIIGFVPELRVDGDATGGTDPTADEASKTDESSESTRTDSADSDAATDPTDSAIDTESDTDSAADTDSAIDDDAVYYEDQVEPEYGILGFTLRELVIVGAWALMFIVSFFPVFGGGASVWTSGIDWLLTVGAPTAAVFLVVLRRFSPEGIRRVGSLGIDQFASVAASVAAVAWAQVLWHQVSASVSLGAFLVGWVPIVAVIGALALVVATVFAPLIPRLREDFEGRLETLAHRNADPVRPVIRRPRPTPPAPAPSVEGEPDTLDPTADSGPEIDASAPQAEAAAVVEDDTDQDEDADATRVIDVSPLVEAPDSEARQEGTSYTDPIGALHEIFESNGTVVPGSSEEEDHGPGDTTHSRGEAEALLRRNRSEHPRPVDPDAQPFWILASTERDVLDERGQPLYRIGPSAWTLVIEDRDGAYVVRHDDGRIGYLHDLTDITKG
ncbi:hypothetical protein QF046_000117 [Microbacterium sp. W4I4]|uniref:hypothetical protein n=1 Tax=Microbacterium sp. W4I4 TaxID=3042295 RepID=UPI002788FE8C|nr:hypothetical protein [Microbacterium sp. W4I4]MDQ0612476.1 hypothetical protein [Microbacterium sp. W4I4]